MVKPDYFSITEKLNKLFLWHRISLYKIAHHSGLYQGQLPVLAFIQKNEGCTQKEVANQLGVSAASVASSTKRLQRAGMIRKKIDETNLRQNMLYLTEEGEKTTEKTCKMMDEFHLSFFQGFSENELELLGQFLDRMIHNVAGKDSSVDLFSLIHLEMKTEKEGKEKN